MLQCTVSMQTVTEYAAGGAVFKRFDGQLVWLVQKAAGKKAWWQLPKGHIEKGESKEQTALREVKEESGITARIITELGSKEYYFVANNKRIHKIVSWFLMEYISGTTDDFDPKEVVTAIFLTYDKAVGILTYDSEKQILQEADKLVRAGDFTLNRA